MLQIKFEFFIQTIASLHSSYTGYAVFSWAVTALDVSVIGNRTLSYYWNKMAAQSTPLASVCKMKSWANFAIRKTGGWAMATLNLWKARSCSSTQCKRTPFLSKLLKANSRIACRDHAVPLPCRAALIHTCRAAHLPCSDSSVSFVKFRAVAGNIRTSSTTV